MPENYFDPEKGVKGEDFRKDYDTLSAFKAADDSRRLKLPKSPDEFKIELSKEFKPPEGVTFQIDDKNPLWAQGKQFMFDMQTGKISGQQAMSKMADLYAGAMISDQLTIKTARDAEIAKLGAAGPARITALNTWLDAVGAPSLKQMLVTEKMVTEFEGLIQRYQSQGGGNYSGSRREGIEAERVSEAAYAKMSFAEKKEYAEKFQQPAAQNGAGR